jgi:hypothetical protein
MTSSAAYWTHDLAIGTTSVADTLTTIRLMVHSDTGDYHTRTVEPLFPLAYTLEDRSPLPSLQLAALPKPYPMGDRRAAEWEGLRERDIGQAQAWYYPQDNVTVLWECFLSTEPRNAVPYHDAVLTCLWQGVEQVLLARFAKTHYLATPATDAAYRTVAYQQFLLGRGYHRMSAAAFLKTVRA